MKVLQLIPFLAIFLFLSNDIYGQQQDSKSTVLVNPTNSSTTLSVEGNQITDLTLKNSNFLGILLTVPEPKPFQGNSSVTLLPYGSSTKEYSVFAELPVYWSWTVKTYSDAANVLITATWQAL